MKYSLKLLLPVGVLIFLVGFVYSFLIAGIPYQDPTPEMMEKYSRNEQIGEVLLKIGFATIIFGIALKIARKYVRK